MIGILLIMHEPLANAFMATAAHMFEGPQERIEAIDVRADQDLNDLNSRASQAVTRLDDGSGVLVLTDVLGGTPSNCSCRLTMKGRVEVIAGVSLPMLLRAITYRQNDLETVIEKALSGGKSGAIRIENSG
ncbi:MAG: PTS sugar transporter subunit IIA [Burkholderiaceae bacterium]|jgi:PTS system ascorbate-specific IIA component|nr:PTS sugar transporter subunit IIA [Burkholderiaceae bacterium]